MKANNLIKLKENGFNVPEFDIIKWEDRNKDIDISKYNGKYAIRSSCNLEDNIDVIIDSNNDSSLKEYASKLDIPYINTNNRNEALTFILNSIKEKLLIKINDVKELKLKK
jgi:hypothetical protein